MKDIWKPKRKVWYQKNDDAKLSDEEHFEKMKSDKDYREQFQHEVREAEKHHRARMAAKKRPQTFRRQ